MFKNLPRRHTAVLELINWRQASQKPNLPFKISLRAMPTNCIRIHTRSKVISLFIVMSLLTRIFKKPTCKAKLKFNKLASLIKNQLNQIVLSIPQLPRLQTKNKQLKRSIIKANPKTSSLAPSTQLLIIVISLIENRQ